MLRLACLFAFLWLPVSAIAQDRMALVIGNAAYETLPVLKHPPRETADVAKMLRWQGYDVTLLQNATRRQILQSLEQVTRRARSAEVLTVFYAGHAISVEGASYLLPTDATGKPDDLLFEGVDVREMLDRLPRQTRANIVLLDIHNPFPKSGATFNNPLATLPSPNLPDRTIVLAHAPQGDPLGCCADGVRLEYSPLADELLRQLAQDTIRVEALARSMRNRLNALAITHRPLETTSTLEEDVFFGAPPRAVAERPTAPQPSDAAPSTNSEASRPRIQALSAKPSRGAKVDSGRGWSVAGKTQAPSFPWPPPQPSGTVRLSLESVREPASGNTVGGIMLVVEEALDAQGYHDRSFWSVPGGAALATRLERIDRNGQPIETPTRWPTARLETDFSLGAYLKSLFYTEPGFFRVIVFVLSTEAIISSDRNATSDEALDWLRRGMVSLPKEIAEQDLTVAHNLTALIYEFEKAPDADAVVLAPGRLTGREHLRSAGLTAMFARN